MPDKKKRVNYYPFGLKHKGYNNVVSSNGNSLAQKYGFGGKEFNDELGLNWYDVQARNYDPALGKWMNLDPHASNYYEWSPYNYVGANPIIRADPDGKDWLDKIAGAVIGAVTNIVPGSTSLRANYTPNDASDYNNSLKVTDALATGAGAVMMIDGAVKVGGGLATAAAGGGLSLTGVGAVVGAPAAAAGLTLAGAGAVEMGAGALLMSNSANNKAAGYNYGDKSSGSYTTTHKSGQKYHGKGKEARAKKSGNEKAKANNDPVVDTDWTPSANNREGFKAEYKRMQTDATKKTPEGYKSNNNYNKRQSPGKKYTEQDK